MREYPEFGDLVGKTFTSVENINDEEIVFTAESGERYKLYHCQDCCESVTVEDITGDLEDLCGTPVLMAAEVSNEDGPMPDYAESFTWTFYNIATIKGAVTIRWLGESNGYYSESVDFAKIAA